MKETPQHFISHYRASVLAIEECGGTRVAYQAPPVALTPSRRISQAVEQLKLWTLICGTIALFWYGFTWASNLADHWFIDGEAAREAEVGKGLPALLAYYELWGSPVIGRRYDVPDLAQYGLPTDLIFRGWADREVKLPREGNRIGDFWRVKHSPHIFVWTGAAWIDP